MNKLGTLFVTHSSRITDLNLCSVNYLTRRYAASDRLKNLPAFEQLPPASKFDGYSGMVSFFSLQLDNGSLEVKNIGTIQDSRKIQHVAQLSENKLVVVFESGVQIWIFPCPVHDLKKKDLGFVEKHNFPDHPLFSGIHTVFLKDDRTAVLSCSASDAALILDLKNENPVQMIRMPEKIYGHNYPIDEKSDLRAHYIHNDAQTTHINSAWPDPDGGIIVSTLIQGAIGKFDPGLKNYTELTRGFVGCHGVRRTREGIIYFADSVTGSLIFLSENGRIINRYAVDSRWLHDVHQIKNDIFAFSVSDKNELRLIDIKQDKILYRKKFLTIPDTRLNFVRNRLNAWRGNSTQFLSVSLKE